eukprot:4635496-Ditylum_brightwellii.AAC.1
MFKSNFDKDTHPEHLEVAQFVARVSIKNKAVGYSQHIAGDKNIIADCLSRQAYLLDLLAGANHAQTEGTKRPTHEKYARNWARWCKFCQMLGLLDPSMRLLHPHHQ